MVKFQNEHVKLLIDRNKLGKIFCAFMHTRKINRKCSNYHFTLITMLHN